MDPAELIVTALTAGAVAAAEGLASTAVRDAYQRLRQLVMERFSGNDGIKAALARHEARPRIGRFWLLEARLRNSGRHRDRRNRRRASG